MDDVIYSASPLQTFLGAFGMIAFFFALGIAGLGFGILRRNESTIARLAAAGAGVFLILAGIVSTVVTIGTINSGSQTVAIHVNDKFVALDNCGDSDTCERYMLETQSGTNSIDVQVNHATYDKTQIGGCYELTYYPGRSLLGGQEYEYSYQSVTNITRLAVADPSACE